MQRGKSKRSQKARKKLYTLHAWVGFHLATIMALVLFTGTFATVANEIDWLLQRDMRVSPGESMVSLGEMHKSITQAYPEDTIIALFSMKSDHFAYRARMRDEHGRQFFVHINQWTGEVTGISQTLTVQRFFRDLHRYLFMPVAIGLPVVTSMAFILAISLYTGLKTVRKWRTAATSVRFNQGLRVAVSDSHKTFGLWSLWFLVVMIITGIWYLSEFGGAAVKNPFEPERPKLSEQQMQNHGTRIQDVDITDVIGKVKSVYPELEPRTIFFSQVAGQPIQVQGRNNDFLIRDRANRVFLDPVTLEVLKIQRASEIGLVPYLNEVADPLHFGYFGGLPTKLIWFVFGLFLTGLSVGGVWLTWKRLRSSRLSRAQITTLPVLVLMLYFSVSWYQRITGPAPPSAEHSIAGETLDGITSELAIELDDQNTPSGKIRLILHAYEGRPNVKDVSFVVEESGSEITVPVRFLGKRTVVRTTLPLQDINKLNSITTKTRFYSGVEWSQDWILGTKADYLGVRASAHTSTRSIP